MTPATLLPSAIESERAFLSACMQDEACLAEFAGAVSADWFHDFRNKHLWLHLVDRLNSQNPFDFTACVNALTGKVEASYLAEISTEVITSACADEYVEAIKKAHQGREIIVLAHELSQLAHRPDEDALGYLQREMERITNAAQKKIQSNTWNESLMGLINSIEADFKRGGKLPGLSTGIDSLDHATGGICPAELWIIAADTSVGKSALALHIAAKAAEDGTGVFIASAEMSRTEIARRVVSNKASIDYRKLRFSQFERPEFTALSGSIISLSRYPIFIADGSDQSIASIRSAARLMHIKHGVTLVVVDYIQLIGATVNRGDNRERVIASISSGLKQMARELNVGVLALTQVNDDGRVRESRAIGHDADTLISLRDGDNEFEKRITVLKNRNGERNQQITVGWIGKYQRFTSQAEERR